MLALLANNIGAILANIGAILNNSKQWHNFNADDLGTKILSVQGER